MSEILEFLEEIGEVVSFDGDHGICVGIVCRAFCEPGSDQLRYDVAVANRGIIRSEGRVFRWHGDIPVVRNK